MRVPMLNYMTGNRRKDRQEGNDDEGQDAAIGVRQTKQSIAWTRVLVSSLTQTEADTKGFLFFSSE